MVRCSNTCFTAMFSKTLLAQHWFSIGFMPCICWGQVTNEMNGVLGHFRNKRLNRARWHCEFEPWRSEAEHATYRSRRLPTIWNLHKWAGKTYFVSLKDEGQSEDWTLDLRLSKQAALTTTPGPPPLLGWHLLHFIESHHGIVWSMSYYFVLIYFLWELSNHDYYRM